MAILDCGKARGGCCHHSRLSTLGVFLPHLRKPLTRPTTGSCFVCFSPTASFRCLHVWNRVPTPCGWLSFGAKGHPNLLAVGSGPLHSSSRGESMEGQRQRKQLLNPTWKWAWVDTSGLERTGADWSGLERTRADRSACYVRRPRLSGTFHGR